MLSSSTSSNESDGPLLPKYMDDKYSKQAQRSSSSLRSLLGRRRRVLYYLVLAIVSLLILFHARLKVAWRDFGYIIRPLWDTPREGTRPWDVIPHFSNPHPGSRNNASWCALHGWEPRTSPAVIVDTIPISSELDLLEIRMREYAGVVNTMIIIESTMTYAGTPQKLHLEPQMERFKVLARETGIRLVYKRVGEDFTPNLPKGSFENEALQRGKIGQLVNDERDAGRIPDGALVLIADTDELISREALELLAACKVPDTVHLNLKNYRFSYDLPLFDDGNWVPKVMTIKPGEAFWYTRQRIPDAPLLENAGWHCTFCFPTLEDMRAKMFGYSHNDRLTSKSLLKEKVLRKKVCTGQDPFGMWPEVFTFRDLLIQSGDIKPMRSYQHLPLALKQDPKRFPYLVDKGCERPNK